MSLLHGVLAGCAIASPRDLFRQTWCCVMCFEDGRVDRDGSVELELAQLLCGDARNSVQALTRVMRKADRLSTYETGFEFELATRRELDRPGRSRRGSN